METSMEAEDCLRAPKSIQDDWISKEAVLRGLQSTKPQGKPWSSFQVLPSGPRARLLQYEELMKEKGYDRQASFFFNLSQTPQHHGLPPEGLIPTITRNTWFWSNRLRRTVLPLEVAELMGIEVFCPDLPAVMLEMNEDGRSKDP